MGDHRCISKRVVEAFSFLELPITAQYLYFHLILNTDDRRVVEAGNILRLTKTNTGDLQSLIDHQYVIPLNAYLVSYLPDMNEHNKLRADRIKESKYHDLLIQVIPGIQLQEIRPRADRPPINKQNTVGTSQGQPKVRQDKLTQDNNSTYGGMRTEYDYDAIERVMSGHISVT